MGQIQQIFTYVLRPGTAAVAVAVVVVTFFIRRIVENLVPSLHQSKEEKAKGIYKSRPAMWWNSVVLYAIPVVLGAATAFLKSEFLHGALDTLGAKILFQGGVGWFAGFLYKVLRKAIIKQVGVDIEPASDPPPPDVEEPVEEPSVEEPKD